MPEVWPNRIGLLAAYAILLIYALYPGWSQDFLPWYSAGQLLLAGQADQIYLPGDARDLFSSSASFIQTSLSAAGGAAEADEITAFVAPPPSLLLTLPLNVFPYPVAAVLWRLALAGIAIAALHGLAPRRGQVENGEAHRWTLGVLLFLPLFAYTIGVGQPSMFLLGAAVLAEPSRRCWAPWVFAAALSAAIVFKAFPALLVGFLFLMGRRALCGWVLGICGLWTTLSFVFLPGALWIDFFEALRAVGRGVITDTNNLSIDALLLRLASGETTTLFATPPTWVQLVAGAAKAGVLALAVATAVGWRQLDAERRWGAAWVATLSLSPLVWAPYLVVLPAILPCRSARDQRRRLALLAAVGGWMLLHAVRLFPTLVLGTMGSLFWLLAVTAVLFGETPRRSDPAAD
jgi:hypothetical protein